MEFADRKVGDDWPLSDRQLAILRDNRPELVRSLRVDDEILSQMRKCGGVTEAQMHHVLSKHTPEKRNGAVLDLLPRSSLRTYRQLVDSLKLRKSNHNAVRILEAGAAGKLRKQLAESSVVSR